MEFLEHWRLRERPFEPTWDSRFFFQSRAHDEALQRLGFVVSEQTMLLGVLTGEVGCGKTLTRAVLADRLPPRQFVVITHENSAFDFNDLLGITLKKLIGSDEPLESSKGARWYLFERVVEPPQLERPCRWATEATWTLDALTAETSRDPDKAKLVAEKFRFTA